MSTTTFQGPSSASLLVEPTTEFTLRCGPQIFGMSWRRDIRAKDADFRVRREVR